MSEHWLTAFFDVNNNQTMTNVLEKLCQVDVCFTNRLEETACKMGIDHRPFLRMYKQCVVSDIFFTPIHKYANYFQILVSLWYVFIHSSTYIKKVNDITGWLSQTTDTSKYFVWSPGLRDYELPVFTIWETLSRLECGVKLFHFIKRSSQMYLLFMFPLFPENQKSII